MPKEAIKKALIVAVVYVIVAVLLFLIVNYDLLSLGSNPNFGLILSVLKTGLLYLVASIVLSATATITKILFKGTFIAPVSNALNGFVAAFLTYFVLTIQFVPLQIQALSLYVFFLIIIGSAYYLLDFVLRNYHQFIVLGLVRSIVLVVSGVILRFAVLACFGGEMAVLSDILLYGFLFAAAAALFFPLRFSHRSSVKKVGGWLGAGTWQKIVLGIILASYVLSLRSIFLQFNSNVTLISEWIFIGVVSAIAYFRLKFRLDAISAPLILESWAKHQQELGFKTTEEFRILTDEVDAFLKRGEKNGILLFLIHFLFERKVNADQIDSVLDELINYQDPVKPHWISSWDNHFLEEANLQRRRHVLDRVIKSLNADLFKNKPWS